MKHGFTLIAAIAGAALAAPALAQELPKWRLDEACAREASDRSFCVAFEREAHSNLSGVWPTLAGDIRQTCLDQIAAFDQNSYRLLEGCIETKLTAARVDYVRRASRADEPDPPKQPEIAPEAQPGPAAASPADQPESTAPATPEPPAGEALATTPPPANDQAPAAAETEAEPPAPADEAPKPQ